VQPSSADIKAPVVKQPKKFPVIELFGPTIQGEGSSAGTQTLFIRFGGCDYRCKRCDSLHAVMPQAIKKHAQWLTAEEIFGWVQQQHILTGVRWVTFSGGNPAMLQLDELVQMLRTHDFQINVETQGTLWQDWLFNCTQVTISPKSPGMGEKFEADKFQRMISNLIGWKTPICIKVVIFSQQDLEFALLVQDLVTSLWKNLYTGEEMEPTISFYLSLGNAYQPVLNENNDLVDQPEEPPLFSAGSIPEKLLQDFRSLAEDILPDPRFKLWRFLPQLHVLVWSNEAKR